MSKGTTVRKLARMIFAALRVRLPILVSVALVIVVARWYLKDPRLLLDYVKTLAWPILIGMVIYWLRGPLQTKVAQLLRVDFAGARAEFGPMITENLERDLQEPAEVLAASSSNVTQESQEDRFVVKSPGQDGHKKDEAIPPPAITEHLSTTPNKPAVKKQDNETARRGAIERIIVESAAWGYDMAQLGYQSRPTPRVEWDLDGRPRISNLQSSKTLARKKVDSNSIGYDPYIKAQNLAEEIRRLEKSVSAPLSINHIASLTASGDPREADKKLLDKLKSRLARLDPNSAYID